MMRTRWLSPMRCFFGLAVIISSLAGIGWSQVVETPEYDTDWQISLVSGFFTGGTFMHTKIEDEPVAAEADDGWLVGMRIGAEQEYLGWEVTLAGVFADMDIKADPFASSPPSATDYNLFLANINANWFVFGNDMADGRVRPFLTAGPGLAYLNTDFDQADNEVMFAFNVGAGIKFLLGDEGNPVLRLDWRWHQIIGSTAGLENSMYRQELSVGIGVRF